MKKILLVDDQDDLLFLEESMLSDCPYAVITAHNGREAYEKARTEQPDLILMDVMMPVMDGAQSCRALKADSRTAAIPVVMVTALERDQIACTGYDDYLAKPFDCDTLVAKIKTFLN